MPAKRLSLFIPFILIAAPSLVLAAPSPEGASVDAGTVFMRALEFSGQLRFAPAIPLPPAPASGGTEFEDYSAIDALHIHTPHVGPQSFVRAGVQPSQSLDLAGLLDRNLKTGLNANLGGKSVWLSGLFDRGTFDGGKSAYVEPSAFASLLIDGEPAASIFKVTDLLMNPQTLTIGGGQFKVKLSPDLTDMLASEIVIINLANNHKDRITLRDMLNSVGNSGAAVVAGGQTYKLFYYDEVKNGRLDPASKLFAFIANDANGAFHVFVVPSELIPSDKAAIFKMLDGRSLGLQHSGTQLLVFGNP
jgi:hypothetical protein